MQTFPAFSVVSALRASIMVGDSPASSAKKLSGEEREGKIPSADVSRVVDEMQANTRLWGCHHRFLVSHSLPSLLSCVAH
jgi:hypothetical protein